jgi:hypothetical protein
LKDCNLVLYGNIDEKLEKQFRIRVIEKYGAQNRAIIKALEEAIKLWLKS